MNSVLVRGLELPSLGVLVANMLRVVALLTAYLTNLSHNVVPPNTVSARKESIPRPGALAVGG